MVSTRPLSPGAGFKVPDTRYHAQTGLLSAEERMVITC